ASLADALVGLRELDEALRPRPTLAPPAPAAASRYDEAVPTSSTVVFSEMDAAEAAGQPAEPPSVHLMREQSLMAFEGRESIVPLTQGGGPASMLPEDAPGAA